MERPVILIADLDRDSRVIFRAALEWAGYSVLDADEPGRAMELARQHAPDLIIGDFPMGAVGGYPLTEAMLRDESRPTRTRVFTVTARPSDTWPYAGREAADLVLMKPLEPRRMLTEVERLVGNPTGA